VAENTSKLTERYQIVDAMENAFKAGYKWEVVDEHRTVGRPGDAHEMAIVEPARVGAGPRGEGVPVEQ
jgi:hypothetical protein